jgi:8-oxo-dGTP pyrophosphatase MutT (NUDIX family)
MLKWDASNTDEFKNRLNRVLKNRKRRIISNNSRKLSAVLIPLYLHNFEPHILFTRRSQLVQYHRGEICFPGGGAETDDLSLLHTALRETREEIGLPAENIEIIGILDDVLTITSNYIITPYVGFLKKKQPYLVNHLEIEHIIEIPVFTLLKEGSLITGSSTIYEDVPFTAYTFLYQNYRIVGATAGILKQFLDVYSGIF